MVKKSANAGDVGLIPGLGRSSGVGSGSILSWRSPWTEEPDGATVHTGCKELDATEHGTVSTENTRCKYTAPLA